MSILDDLSKMVEMVRSVDKSVSGIVEMARSMDRSDLVDELLRLKSRVRELLEENRALKERILEENRALRERLMEENRALKERVKDRLRPDEDPFPYEGIYWFESP